MDTILLFIIVGLLLLQVIVLFNLRPTVKDKERLYVVVHDDESIEAFKKVLRLIENQTSALQRLADEHTNELKRRHHREIVSRNKIVIEEEDSLDKE